MSGSVGLRPEAQRRLARATASPLSCSGGSSSTWLRVPTEAGAALRGCHSSANPMPAASTRTAEDLATCLRPKAFAREGICQNYQLSLSPNSRMTAALSLPAARHSSATGNGRKRSSPKGGLNGRQPSHEMLLKFSILWSNPFDECVACETCGGRRLERQIRQGQKTNRGMVQGGFMKEPASPSEEILPGVVQSIELVRLVSERFLRIVMANGLNFWRLGMRLGHSSSVRLYSSSAAPVRWRDALRPQPSHGALVKVGSAAFIIIMARR